MPTDVKWTKELEFGIPVIDRDHRMMIEIMNDFLQRTAACAELQTVLRTMRSLIDYAKMHFAHEHHLFKEIKYEDSVGHRELHDRFIENIKIKLSLSSTDELNRLSHDYVRQV